MACRQGYDLEQLAACVMSCASLDRIGRRRRDGTFLDVFTRRARRGAGGQRVPQGVIAIPSQAYLAAKAS